jgi:hypothetical protein
MDLRDVVPGSSSVKLLKEVLLMEKYGFDKDLSREELLPVTRKV